MNLHYAGQHPDWQSVKPSDRNRWQRLAARTNGWATPSNFITVTGVIIVLGGLLAILRQQYWLGLALVAVGRLFDLIDGWLAARTGTKSPLGETFDAAADKIILALTLVVLPLAHLMPWYAALSLLIMHGIISLVSGLARIRNYGHHPSPLGKFVAATIWVSLVVMFVVYALHRPSAHRVSLIITWLILVASAAHTISYIRRFRSASALARRDSPGN